MKLLTTALVGLLLLGGAGTAQAATTQDDTLLANLRAQIKALEAQIAEIEARQAPKMTFKVNNTYAVVYEDYGAYVMTIDVTAGKEGVYIPRTTSDSTNGDTGFAYSVKGDDFKGERDSTVKCGTKKNRHCYVKPGKTSNLTVIVWLTPETSSSNAVSFDKIGYFAGKEVTLRYADIKQKTEEIGIGE